MTNMPWYEWRNIRERLTLFGRAIQGISPYRVRLEPDPAKCPTGYCDFQRREIVVNPGVLGAKPPDQYRLTKAILVHESGHRRFTTPADSSPLVHKVSNILEDERVERLMADGFAGLRPFVRELSEALYEQSPEIDEASESAGEVVAYFLQLRWARRLGRPVKGALSAVNQERWEKVEELVLEAWEAETSETVNRNAEEIVRILGLKEFELPSWVIELLEKIGCGRGERHADDRAEAAEATSSSEEGKAGDDASTEPFDGEIPPNDSRLGSGTDAIEPQPYVALEDKVRPLAEKLIEELSFDEAAAKIESAERGGRFSVREFLRDRSSPFLVAEEALHLPPTMAVKVIVDHSTSLNLRTANGTRMQSIAEAVMMLHLVCLELEIRHEVIVTPQALTIADSAIGERGKALIAGLVPAKCGYEDMGKAIQNHAAPMAEDPEDLKLVVCLTDGACNDAELGKTLCRALRGRVDVTGVLLDPDDSTRNFVGDMFGEDRLISCRSEELPERLARMLRAIRGI
jgi:hypothetical protein